MTEKGAPTVANRPSRFSHHKQQPPTEYVQAGCNEELQRQKGLRKGTTTIHEIRSLLHLHKTNLTNRTAEPTAPNPLVHPGTQSMRTRTPEFVLERGGTSSASTSASSTSTSRHNNAVLVTRRSGAGKSSNASDDRSGGVGGSAAKVLGNRRGRDPPTSPHCRTTTPHRPPHKRPPPPLLSSPLLPLSRSAAWLVAVYLYVGTVCVFFAVEFVVLHRFLLPAGKGGGGAGDSAAERRGSLPTRPHPFLAEPSSDGDLDATMGPRNVHPAPGLDAAAAAAELGEAAVAMPGRAVPLVARRDRRGVWHPRASSLNASMTTIRQQWFADARPAAAVAAPFPVAVADDRKRDVLGVVRITKTGSTSLLSFLSASKAAHTFDNSLKVDRTRKVVGDRVVPYCFYEPRAGTKATDAGMGSFVNQDQCGHRTYARMVSILLRQLADYRDNDDDDGAKGSRTPIQLSLSIITVIRDPFDRMLSFFRYFREIYPDWAPMYKAQPQVLHALQDGDFPAFLRELALLPNHEWTRRYQYEYFGRTADEAIRTVREVRVLPLLNECFNASVYLLAHQYPALFPPDQPAATDQFLGSGSSHSRRTHGADAEASLLHPDLRAARAFDREAVALEARQSWLRDEYRFYDSSKLVLGRILQMAASTPGSIVDPALVRECLDRLDLSRSPPPSDVAAVA
jgi:Sulfotransferase family